MEQRANTYEISKCFSYERLVVVVCTIATRIVHKNVKNVHHIYIYDRFVLLLLTTHWKMATRKPINMKSYEFTYKLQQFVLHLLLATSHWLKLLLINANATCTHITQVYIKTLRRSEYGGGGDRLPFLAIPQRSMPSLWDNFDFIQNNQIHIFLIYKFRI